jgi:signal transduction histidine kinase
MEHKETNDRSIGIGEENTEENEMVDDFNSIMYSLNEHSTDVIRLLTNVAIFLKIQEGNYNLNHSDFNIRDCIEETERFIKKIDSSETHVDITIHLSNLPEKECHRGDRIRIQQVLHHLLTNAFNHTESGSIVVNTNTRRIDSSVDEMIMTVSDNGSGISSKRLEDIYNPFETHENGGGLGLYISKHIISLMDGSIDIKSTEGEGTVVSLRIPLQRSPKL